VLRGGMAAARGREIEVCGGSVVRGGTLRMEVVVVLCVCWCVYVCVCRQTGIPLRCEEKR
jgi:hypothetical protein